MTLADKKAQDDFFKMITDMIEKELVSCCHYNRSLRTYLSVSHMNSTWLLGLSSRVFHQSTVYSTWLYAIRMCSLLGFRDDNYYRLSDFHTNSDGHLDLVLSRNIFSKRTKLISPTFGRVFDVKPNWSAKSQHFIRSELRTTQNSPRDWEKKNTRYPPAPHQPPLHTQMQTFMRKKPPDVCRCERGSGCGGSEDSFPCCSGDQSPFTGSWSCSPYRVRVSSFRVISFVFVNAVNLQEVERLFLIFLALLSRHVLVGDGCTGSRRTLLKSQYALFLLSFCLILAVLVRLNLEGGNFGYSSEDYSRVFHHFQPHFLLFCLSR